MKRRKKPNPFHDPTPPTLFTIRDRRQDQEADFERVDRKVYKTAARKCSEAGVPIRTEVQYRRGRAVKMLTILQLHQNEPAAQGPSSTPQTPVLSANLAQFL